MLKVSALLFFLFDLSVITTCQAQDEKYHDLLDYVSEHLNPPQSVKDVCAWQAALVKLTTNNKGKVIKFDMINKTSDELKNSFRFLLNYQFPAALNAANKTIVFCETFKNEKYECLKERQMTAEDGMHIIYGALTKQMKDNPKTIFLVTTLHQSFGVTEVMH